MILIKSKFIYRYGHNSGLERYNRAIFSIEQAR